MKSFSQFVAEKIVKKLPDGNTGKVVINPKKGEAARTQKLINQKVKDITSPKSGEADATQQLIDKYKRETNISKEGQKRLDDISQQTKIDDDTVKKFKNRLKNIKKLGYDPDDPSTQLQGKTKEQMVRDAESGRTADEGKFKTNKNTTNTTVKTNQTVNKVTQSKTDLKLGQKQLRDIDLDKIQTNKTPRVKRFVTEPKSITDFQGFAKRGAQRTGLAPTKPKIEVGGKLKTLSTNKVTKDILKQTPKRLKLSRALGTLGRVAGGAYAVKDFMDVARKEKALGRSKTSARLGGLSRALGGYIGGGIGATLGSGVAGLPGGIVGGGAGYHYGSKVGDKLYNIGRQYATGEKKLNVGKTFKNLRNDINANTKKLNLRNLGRLDKDKK